MDSSTRDALVGAVLFHNAPTAFLFASALLVLLWEWIGDGNRGANDRGRDLALFSASVSTTYLILLATMDRVFSYYFVLVFPFAGIAGGWLVFRWAAAGLEMMAHKSQPRGRRRSTGVAWVSLALVLLGWWWSPALERRLAYYVSFEDKTVQYSWHPGPLSGWLAGTVRALFWHDRRVIGRRYSTFTYLLWHESRVLESVSAMTEAVRSRADLGDEIFGDASTVPLVAMMAGVPIAGHEVDTNIQRYPDRVARRAIARRIDASAPRFIMVRPRFGVASIAEVQALIRQRYTRVHAVRSDRGEEYVLFERRAAARTIAKRDVR
jgi:hypothetical protein